MRTRKAPEERSVSHSISCTPLQWARMRELAGGAGMRTSPYVVGRVLQREGFGAGDAGPSTGSGQAPATGSGQAHALVLDGAQQRALSDAAASAEAALSQLCGLSGKASAGLRETIALLFEARLDEMAQEGRLEEMETRLAAITGPERAAAIAGRVRARSAHGGAFGSR